jgi:CheY-like chemotaxis protein
VVDDDASVRRALRRLLKILGFNVLVFAGAKELLAGQFPTKNACMLLDIYIPEMGTTDVSQSLARSGRQLPTILMSGHDDAPTRRIMRKTESIAGYSSPLMREFCCELSGQPCRSILRRNQPYDRVASCPGFRENPTLVSGLSMNLGKLTTN